MDIDGYEYENPLYERKNIIFEWKLDNGYILRILKIIENMDNKP